MSKIIRKKNRLTRYNYSLPGAYFVTICVSQMRELLGEIVDKKVILNEFGEIVKEIWENIPKHFKNIILDEWVIMPNHLHGILIIYYNNEREIKDRNEELNDYSYLLQKNKRSQMYLPKVINGFKGAVTRIINQKFPNNEFTWQKSFYDHIIRNDKAIKKIREYIYNNPLNWKMDQAVPENMDKEFIESLKF